MQHAATTEKQNVFARGRPFDVSIGPSHAKIDNLDAWMRELNYDPKQPTAAQRKAIQQEEADQVLSARRRLSEGSHMRHLLNLSSSLQHDLVIFVNYLLDSAGQFDQVVPSVEDGSEFGHAADELAALSKDAYIQLRSLFDLLDVDHSGTLTFDELQHVASILGRETYDAESFRRLDRNLSGSIDFVEMLKAFFPKLSMRHLQKANREWCKYASTNVTARSRIAPENLALIDAQYARVSKMVGGCTVDNMIALMSPYMKRNRDVVEDVFATFDMDSDGVLTLEEFTEMVKFSYPPYAKLPVTHKSSSRSSQDSSVTASLPGPVMFSLEQIAKRRLVDPKKIKLPSIVPLSCKPPYVLHPALSGRTEQRRERNFKRLTKIMGEKSLAMFDPGHFLS